MRYVKITQYFKEPNLSQAFLINKGMKITSTIDPQIVFETLAEVDFRKQIISSFIAFVTALLSINFMMKKFTERRNLIHKLLNDLPGVECSLPGGAFYAFPNVKKTGLSGSEFAQKCMHEAGVAIVPGTAFGNTAQDYVRFSYAASRDNISEALEKIKKMLS